MNRNGATRVSKSDKTERWETLTVKFDSWVFKSCRIRNLTAFVRPSLSTVTFL